MRSVLRSRVPASVFGLILICLTVAGCKTQRSAAPSVPIDDFILRAMDRAGVPGLSLTILEKGRIESTRIFGVKNRAINDPVSERTIFEACSLSKPVFAYAVLTLVAEGKLELDRPVVLYVPEKDLEREFFHGQIADDRIRHITPRMVLSHRTGFPNWRGDEGLKLLADPGAKFGYSGEGFVYFSNGYFGLSLAEELSRRLAGPGHPVFSSTVMDDFDSLDSPIFELAKAISKNNLDEGIWATEKTGASGAPAKTIRESSLNDLGYGLLHKKRTDEAIKVFELNVRLFPRSASVYDSLAEALEKRGDVEAAIRNYERSLALNPDNTNAAARIKAIREKINN